MNRFIKGRFILPAFVLSIPFHGFAQTIYSENFDSGYVGESLTNPQFGFNVYAPGGGDLKLGPAQHGWSGLSMIGDSAPVYQENWLYKFLPLPTHGLIEFSADMFSSLTTSQDDIGMALIPGSPYAPGTSAFGLRDFQNGWESTDGSPTTNVWDSPSGMHNEPVTGSLFWNQDTGEHWAEITDGVNALISPHFFDTHGPMAGIVIFNDRRTLNPVSGDIDNLVVRGRVAAPEPFTMSLGLAGIGLFVRRRMRAKRA
ncbi:MAG: hypothetical protein ACHQ50_05235 [Fimbriimonadales bacterium]